MNRIAMVGFLLLPLAVLGVITAGQLGLFSGAMPTDLGFRDGMLKAPGPNASNVVSSYAKKQIHTAYNEIEPIAFSGDGKVAFDKLMHILAGMDGASIIKSDATYLYAQYQTPLLKFIDDVEFVLDEPAGLIQMRSASRIGRKDFGTNRKRLERIRELFNG